MLRGHALPSHCWCPGLAHEGGTQGGEGTRCQGVTLGGWSPGGISRLPGWRQHSYFSATGQHLAPQRQQRRGQPGHDQRACSPHPSAYRHLIHRRASQLLAHPRSEIRRKAGWCLHTVTLIAGARWQRQQGLYDNCKS